MARNESPNGEDVSKVSRRGLLTLGAMLTGATGLGLFSSSAAAATHDLTVFRDAFIGNDEDKTGLGSKGWLFFAKDTGTVYYHDGSSWQNLPLGGQLTDSDGDGLLEAPNHDGIDVGTVETDEIHLGADTDGDGNDWRLDTDSSDAARIYSWDSSSGTETEYLRVNEGGTIDVKENIDMANNYLKFNTNNQTGVARNVTDGSSTFFDMWRDDGTDRFWQHFNPSSGSGHLNWQDENGDPLLQLNQSGPVEVKNSVLSLAHERSSVPSAPSSGAKIWVDSDTGELKATFANDTTSTLASN